MLSHHDANNLTIDHQNLARVSSRSTISSSSSNTSGNHSPFANTGTRPMEEVWKDINLSTTTTNRHATTAGKGYRGFMLQDFLAKPFSSNDTPTSVSSPGYGSPSPTPPPQQPMVLNLNSGPDQLNFLEPLDVPFDQVLASANSSSGLLGNSIGGMRILPATDRAGAGGDRRHKRMIKNRESAARSRARKQAYTTELENEVERLQKENARLKRQLQQLQLATTSQMTKKSGLQRTSTAPF